MIHYDVKSVETSSLNKSEEVVTFIDCLLFPYYFVVQVKYIYRLICLSVTSPLVPKGELESVNIWPYIQGVKKVI